jgi:hypothetical protein
MYPIGDIRIPITEMVIIHSLETSSAFMQLISSDVTRSLGRRACNRVLVNLTAVQPSPVV